MGQRVGKGAFVPEAANFLNLPFDVVMRMWTAFNDIAEGFGLSLEEFTNICTDARLHDILRCTEKDLTLQCEELFTVFDTDKVKIKETIPPTHF